MKTIKKTFRTNLVVDYNKGTFRVMKREPKKIKPTEIPIRVELIVHIPEKPKLAAKGEITLTDEKVSEILISEL